MAFDQKPGTGSIFKNDKKANNHPDYRGQIITPSGEKLDLSLWLKISQKGVKYFSVSVQPPYNSVPAQPTHPVMQGPATPLDEGMDLPF